MTDRIFEALRPYQEKLTLLQEQNSSLLSALKRVSFYFSEYGGEQIEMEAAEHELVAIVNKAIQEVSNGL